MKKELIKQAITIVVVGFLVFKIGDSLNLISMPSFGKKLEGVSNQVKKDKENNQSEKDKSKKSNLEEATDNIFEGQATVRIKEITYKGDDLSIVGEINNKSKAEIQGYPQQFYIKDVDGEVTNLNFYQNPTFFVKAPAGGKVEFKMKYKNCKLKDNKVIIGGEFVKIGYLGSDKVFEIPISFN